MTWKHSGGGCGLDDSLLPCDDEYHNEETGETITLLSPVEVHFAMPPVIEDMDAFLRVTNCLARGKPESGEGTREAKQ